MKQHLQLLAAKLANRIKEYDTFPRTQSTDAIRTFGTDLLKILEDVIETIPDPVDLEEMISNIVTNQLDSLTAPNKPAAQQANSKKKKQAAEKSDTK